MANWHYEQNGRPTGPVSEDQLRGLVSAGAVTASTKIWREGMGDWQAAGAALPALFSSGAGHGTPPTYTAPSGYGSPVQVENQLVKAILVTLFCCLPFGIVAIIKATEANNKAAVGDVAGANMANEEASKWVKYSVIGWAIGIGLYVLMMGFAVFVNEIQ